MKIASIFVVSCLLLTACSEQRPPEQSGSHVVQETVYTALAHPDRPIKDRRRDNKRKPAEVLEFLGIKPGMTVLETMAADGYYTEVLSRVVGENGSVYSHNNKMYYSYQSDKYVNERLKDNRLPNVVRWDKELGNMQLPEGQFDAVFMMLVFHDFYHLDYENPQRILHQVYDALKPGAILAIVDHSAIEGTEAEAAKRLHGIHRIDEQFVKKVVIQAGFILDDESDLLRNPEDRRDKPFFDPGMKMVPTDRFILRFKKPHQTRASD